MKTPKLSEQQERRLAFEAFEARLVMSAAPLTDVGLDLEAIGVTPQTAISQQLYSTNQETGVSDVHDQYQFDGSNQTVAIIDSGIAWDHADLGGGFGQGHKVVGGWDFAENDSNPYDDGPAGFHGTHVAGIVGSNHEFHKGVASGADLVGLRVFTDSGQGEIEWVEQALAWVHEHRNDFANPITTVNLSLGTDWNADNTPNWATLEDEFRQLEMDGIFISVAAGNSFQNYNEAGLSYPAVSEYVVPVASSDGEQMSDFSQRNDRVLVAPGENIFSTAPDHMFASTGGTNQFLGSSGTSMSSPYVAGASMLLRQANEFMGAENITQDMLYQQFRDTADLIYDSATNDSYHQINIRDAIASVIKDLHSNSWDSATDGGEFGGGEIIKGTIGMVSDSDKFSFVASQTGQMTLTFDATHDLQPLVEVLGTDFQVDGNQVSFQVESGQEYKFSVGTQAGIGHYNIDVNVEQTVQVKDWGTIRSGSTTENIASGENWFKVTADRNGFLTIDANVVSANGNINFELYDSNQNQITSKNSATDLLRLNAAAEAGETFYIRTVGSNASVEFQISNLVSLENGQLNVHGTEMNDSITVSTNENLSVSINGVAYQFDVADISNIRIDGGAGHDTIVTNYGGHANQVILQQNRLDIISQTSVGIQATGFESMTANMAIDADYVLMLDSTLDDMLFVNSETAIMRGESYRNSVTGFDKIRATSFSGTDTARLYGTEGSDRLFVNQANTVFRSGDTRMSIAHFESLSVDARSGNDFARFQGSAGNDHVVLGPTQGSITNDSFSANVSSFERISASAGQGHDTVRFEDSSGNDHYSNGEYGSMLSGSGFSNYATGFDETVVVASGGYDLAQISDSSRSDVVFANRSQTTLSNSEYSTSVIGFDRVNVVSTHGGLDRASITGTDGDDSVYADVSSVSFLNAGGVLNRVVGFDDVSIDGKSGNDVAHLVGSKGNELLRAVREGTSFESTQQIARLMNIAEQNFDGGGGLDELVYTGFDNLDLLEVLGDKAIAYLNEQKINAVDFDFLHAQTDTGESSNTDVDSVDYLFMLRGEWDQK